MLNILTIVLDGMPFITWHLPVFNKLTVPWRWYVVEGVAMPNHCSAWCKGTQPRLSRDGTTQYLESLANHPRIRLYQKEAWDGKIEMVNAPLPNMEDGVLVEIDCDEVWTAQQLDELHSMLFSLNKVRADFWCRFFVGPNLITTGRDCYANNPKWEWRRAWTFRKDARFEAHCPPFMFRSHEPPDATNSEWSVITQDQTERRGLVFDHYAYVNEAQLRFKEEYYGYTDAVKHWRRLQANKVWPARLGDFFPWVKDQTTVTTLL